MIKTFEEIRENRGFPGEVFDIRSYSSSFDIEMQVNTISNLLNMSFFIISSITDDKATIYSVIRIMSKSDLEDVDRFYKERRMAYNREPSVSPYTKI